MHRMNHASGGVLGGCIDSMGVPNTPPDDALGCCIGACIDSMGVPNTPPDDASDESCIGMSDRRSGRMNHASG